jgi:hypothetical protein
MRTGYLQLVIRGIDEVNGQDWNNHFTLCANCLAAFKEVTSVHSG